MSRSTLLLAAVLVAVALAVAAPERGAHARPDPLALLPTLRPAVGLGTAVPGWGDVWMDDRRRGRLLRVDGESGRVLAEIAVDGRVSLAAGAGAMWALEAGGGYAGERRGPLLRIDPATSRVTARIPLRTPEGRAILGFGVLVDGPRLYVWGPRDVLRIDPAAARVTGAVELGEERGELTGMVLRGGELIGSTADGHLVRLDARTGLETGSARLPLAGAALDRAGAGRLLLTAEGTVAALDLAADEVVWQRRLGFRVGGVVEANGTLWAHGSAMDDAGDRLWALDPRTGRVRGSALLPVFGTMSMAALDGDLWITTPGGRVFVLPRWLAASVAR